MRFNSKTVANFLGNLNAMPTGVVGDHVLCVRCSHIFKRPKEICVV
jgi:hypothetical protein